MADGRVLVAGGRGFSGAVNTAERYNAAGVLELAAPMAQARRNASCATLSDGRILVAGGSDGRHTLNSAEIYDPSQDKWEAAASMAVPRAGHTATVTPWGGVLLVGGDTGTGSTDLVEMYQLSLGKFRPVGTLSSPRSNYALAVLPDRRILIAGGSNHDTPLSSIDIYDANRDVLVPGGSMIMARRNFAAAPLLDGTVLLAGGYDAAGNALASTEIYDPKTGKSIAGPDMAEARGDLRAHTLPGNGAVLLAGGVSGGEVLASTETYTPWNGKVNRGAPMHDARTGATSIALGRGGVIIAGGRNGGRYLSGGELYSFANIETDKLDYQPGEVAKIVGSGWKPGEQVTIVIRSLPLDQHQMEFAAAPVADSEGRIRMDGLTIDRNHAGVRFLVHASGSTSEAETLFSNDSFASAVGLRAPNAVSQQRAGVPLLFQGNVSNGSSGIPAGSTITLAIDGMVADSAVPVTGDNGDFTYTASGLEAGTHSISVQYNGGRRGDTTWSPSGILNQSVTLTGTNVTVTVSFNPSATVTFGTSVTVTATAVPDTGGPATGSIVFVDSFCGGCTVAGPITLGGNPATATTDSIFFAGGTHNITAQYTATGVFANNNSTPQTLTVNGAPTRTVVTNGANASTDNQPYGTNETIKATVSPNPACPTCGSPAGTVLFYDITSGTPVVLNGGTPTTLSTSGANGVGSIQVSTLPPGVRTIQAVFTPFGSSFQGSTSSGANNFTYTVQGVAPTAVSVNPSSGSTNNATFQAVVTDPAGFADISRIELLFVVPGTSTNYCDLIYQRAENRFWIVNDAATGWVGPANQGTGGSLGNSQCSVNATTATVVSNGNSLTVNFPVTFLPAFTGTKNIYLYGVSNGNLASGYQLMGTWTGAGGAPTPVSVTPSSGSALSANFQTLVTDAAGFTDISRIELLFVVPGSSTNYCDLIYQRAENRFWIVNDAATAWVGPANQGTGGTLGNSQCSVNASTATVVQNGNNLTVTFPVTFAPGFTGTKNIYLMGVSVSNQTTGYQLMGTWGAGATPTAVSVTPNSGSTATANFQAVVSDTAGFADISRIELLFVVPGTSTNYCDLIYQRAENRFWIVNDAATAWSGPANQGTGGTLGNSQCSVNATTATVVQNGNNLTVTFPVTFAPGFTGTKNIYLMGVSVSNQSSGYQLMGTWSAPGATPTPVSVTPSSGTGSTSNFQAVVTDTAGFADISRIELLFVVPGSSTNYCDLIYQRAENRFWIVNDAATAWVGPANQGTGGPLGNSQCSVNASTATVVQNGNSLTVNFPVTFTPAFSGTKNIYLLGLSGSGPSSGYQLMGTWMVP